MKNQLTPLKETGIYIVEVPKDAIDFQIENNKLEYWNDYEGNNPDQDNWVGIQLPSGDWQILGPITPDSISFDPAPYLDNILVKGWNLDYKKHFYSLLNSCGYYWVNPKIKGFNTTTANETDRAQWYEWQSFEDNLVTGILLSLIKK